MKVEIKYAPQSLADVIYPNKQTETLIQGYASGQLEGHVMLWGSNGTGKTSVANLLPTTIAGAQAAVEDKDYDDVLSQSNIKQYLQSACRYNSLTGQGKFFMVFHEFDNAKVNLNKLWTAMDICQDMLMVIITTNAPMNVHKSLRSRCELIEMPALTPAAVLPRAQQILQSEGMTLPDSQVLSYLNERKALGDMRSYFRMLDRLLYLHSSNLPLPAWTPAAPSLVK